MTGVNPSSTHSQVKLSKSRSDSEKTNKTKKGVNQPKTPKRGPTQNNHKGGPGGIEKFAHCPSFS